MTEARLFVLQRLTAVLLAVMVMVHIIVIVYASGGGLSAAEILGRTRGNFGWALFYQTFVIAAAIHAPIGLRNVLIEWTRLSRQFIDIAMLLFAGLLLFLGSRAVVAVFVGYMS
ncbi:MAG: succinate dehydrogenase [marine bacterium B5-7]|nr:MAG: succinate dehydrogenase [marine bacterium B5-7]